MFPALDLLNTLAPMRVTVGYSGNKFQSRGINYFVTVLNSLYRGSVYMERNNVCLTPEQGQESRMKFVGGNRESRGSYSNVSEIIITCTGLDSWGGGAWNEI
jgi:hypothetical protein